MKWLRAPRRPGRRRPAWSTAIGLWALATSGALVFYVLCPARVGDDTYAFLDWGRDLRDGRLPQLEHRTFHPLPIVAGAVVSVFGRAAPTLAVLLTLTALMMIAAASWQLVRILGFGQPGPALASVLVLASPLLSLLGLVAYINVPFAALVLWALVFELRRRPAWAWALLWAAGLVRPEGWAFLIGYGVLEWSRSRRPWAAGELVRRVLLSVGPPALWMSLEWVSFGSPLYSFIYTRPPYVTATASGSVAGLSGSLEFALPTAVIVGAGIGAVALARSPRMPASGEVLGATGIAAGTIAVLVAASFNLPGRHLSALAALLDVLAAVGTVVPALVLARDTRFTRRRLAAVRVASVAVVAGLAAVPTVKLWEQNFASVRVTESTGRMLEQAVRTIPRRATAELARHTVAMLGASYESELAWYLIRPLEVVTDRLGPGTRLVVEPGPATYLRLRRLGLTHRRRASLRPPWRALVIGDWEVYERGPVSSPASVR